MNRGKQAVKELQLQMIKNMDSKNLLLPRSTASAILAHINMLENIILGDDK
jgi:hypothetical protein